MASNSIQTVNEKLKNETVRVYRNLHRKCWSVKYKGKVIGYADNLVMTNCRFIVSEAGRDRVRKTGNKNVHAYIEGNIQYTGNSAKLSAARTQQRLNNVAYNPYTDNHFVEFITVSASIQKQPIYYASKVWLLSSSEHNEYEVLIPEGDGDNTDDRKSNTV